MIIPKNWSTMKKLMFLQQTGGGSVVIEDTVSGNPVVFTTDLSKPLKRLALSLLPRQSGTGDPSPSNIRPLLPWGEVGTWTGGKNLLNPNTDEWKKRNEAYLYINGVVPAGATARFTLEVKDDTADISGCSIGFVEEDLAESSPVSYRWAINSGTVKSDMSNLSQFQRRCSNVFIYPATNETVQKLFNRFNIMVELGSTATAYEPYTPIIPHPVNLQKNLVNFAMCTAGKTAFGLTSAMNGQYFRFTGTCSSGGSHTWVFGNVNAEQRGLIASLNLKGFVFDGSGVIIYAISFNADNGNISITLGGLVTGASYDFSVGVVAYEGETVPTAYQPYLPPVCGASVDLTTGEVWGTHALWTKNTASMDNADNVPGWRNSGIRELIGAGQNKEFGNQVMNVGAYWSANTNSTNDILFLRSARYNDMSQSDWQALAIDVQIAVELTTPVLLATLTPQQISALVGVNTVWSDADGIELTYLKKG